MIALIGAIEFNRNIFLTIAISSLFLVIADHPIEIAIGIDYYWLDLDSDGGTDPEM